MQLLQSWLASIYLTYTVCWSALPDHAMRYLVQPYHILTCHYLMRFDMICLPACLPCRSTGIAVLALIKAFPSDMAQIDLINSYALFFFAELSWWLVRAVQRIAWLGSGPTDDSCKLVVFIRSWWFALTALPTVMKESCTDWHESGNHILCESHTILHFILLHFTSLPQL